MRQQHQSETSWSPSGPASNPADSGSRRVSLDHAGGECRGGAVELSGCMQTDSPDLAARRAWRTAEVWVTSSQDSVEHLVREEAMTPGSAGCYVAVCGRSVRAAALACPPGPRCPACIAVRDADAASERRRHRQCPPGLWTWLNLVRRGRHRAAGTTGGAFDAD